MAAATFAYLAFLAMLREQVKESTDILWFKVKASGSPEV